VLKPSSTAKKSQLDTSSSPAPKKKTRLQTESPVQKPSAANETLVDHVLPRSDQDLLNRHLTTLATGGVVQPTEAELHAAYKLIANMALQQHRDQTIQTPIVTGTQSQSDIDDDDNKMEDEDVTDDDEAEGGTDDDEAEGGTDDDEDEGVSEDESAPDDEDYVEGQDDTSNASSEVKEKTKGKHCN
jgi:hypothetical protein